MNIIKRELKLGLKPFIFWSIGLFLLVFAGMIKFTGIGESGATITKITDQIPRIVQALLGLVDLDITTLGGYYAVLVFYVLLCACIYAISLATNAVSREEIDKTYEFIFTKPRSRSYILSMKMIASVLYLTGFMFLSLVFSFMGLQMLNLNVSLTNEIITFSATTYLVSLVYFSVAALISTVVKRAEQSGFIANMLFLVTFLVAIVVDMMEKPGLLRVLSPLKYFTPVDVLNGSVPWTYVIISLSLIILSIAGTYVFFNKKDMRAIG